MLVGLGATPLQGWDGRLNPAVQVLGDAPARLGAQRHDSYLQSTELESAAIHFSRMTLAQQQQKLLAFKPSTIATNQDNCVSIMQHHA